MEHPEYPKKDHEQIIKDLNTADKKFCTTRSGIDWSNEEVADFILAKGRRGIKKHSELRDYLSKSQEDLRRSREVYPTQGFPEKNLYSGMYRRAYNPLSRGEHSSNAAPNMEQEIVDYGGGE